MKANIYIRTSTSINQSPELQLKDCKKYCDERGWEILEVVSEQASAFKDESKRPKFNDMIARAKSGEFNHIVVWNMDRFSRQPEAEVLKLVKLLSLVHGVEVHAVHGDVWSELVQSVSKIKDMGFVGEAISEFLEKLLRGFEFQRANRESLVKSERIKLAIRKTPGQRTKSYKGNVWGRKSKVNQKLIDQVLDLRKRGCSIREIADSVYLWDDSNHKKFISKSYVHKLLSENSKKLKDNSSQNEGVQTSTKSMDKKIY